MHLFLLPGIDGTGDLFAPLQDSLGSYATTTVVRYKKEKSFDDYVESVASFLPEENAVLIAESFSGPVALALLERYPSRIKCAVLSATFAISPFRGLTKIAKYVPTIFFTPNPMRLQMIKAFSLSKQPDKQLLNLVKRVIHSNTPDIVKQRLVVLSTIDMRSTLPKITRPVLYLKAAQDKIVGNELSNMLVRGLPDVEVCEIDGPHMLLQTCPDECTHEIKRFLSTCLD
ncbi:MAG: hypothetical protein EP297_02155 [Gammaproteobacteria bacterium]|nr:MAG: hypothetical protein EP297_02155 [Gammaproteobacteria bacterium]